MSVCSTTSQMSQMSINFRGEEKQLEESLDQVFRDLQSNLNQSHCSIRSILQSDEQDGDYSSVLDLCHDIDERILAMNTLFKELQVVLKQVSKPSDAEEKEIYKTTVERWKRLKAEQKNNERA